MTTTCDMIWSLRERRPMVTLMVDSQQSSLLDEIDAIVKSDSPAPISVTLHSIHEGTIIQIQAGDLQRGQRKVPRIVEALEIRLRRLNLNLRITDAVNPLIQK